MQNCALLNQTLISSWACLAVTGPPPARGDRESFPGIGVRKPSNCSLMAVPAGGSPPRGDPEGKSKGKAAAGGDATLKRKRGMFSKELRLMLYGFGDDPDPLPETVELVEDIVVDYITDMVHKAQDVALRRQKLGLEDLLFLIRKDPRKFARVKELLAMNEELKKARKNFEVEGETAVPEAE
eukprot:TRINITY_DN35952_c0_g1_i1.p1 TRINITY_DN35952_c0_g1~~TRINITY_DN35952_c0_g1_i1.p1  ORF type:complete len:182 (-),score=41.68 TRINITY_DN35952_c0_g1_i1:671-1216(-)